jgi:hypothetical protein
MAKRLTFHYDRVGDILHIDRVAPHAAQEVEELSESVVARMNPETGEIEGLEVHSYSARLLRGDDLELPVFADLRPAV